MSELVDKWEPTGLLYGHENLTPLAKSLEEAYQVIKQASANEDEIEWESGFVLPALSRTYRKIDEAEKIDGEKFAKLFIEKSKENNFKSIVKDLAAYYAVDGEAELADIFSDFYAYNEMGYDVGVEIDNFQSHIKQSINE